jgi:hypothetical protein
MFKTFVVGCLLIQGQLVQDTCITLEAPNYVNTAQECQELSSAAYPVLADKMVEAYGLQTLEAVGAELNARTYCMTPEQETEFKKTLTPQPAVKGLDAKYSG